MPVRHGLASNRGMSAMTNKLVDRRQILQAGSATLAAASLTWPLLAETAADDKPLNVLFFTKSAGFQHSVITRQRANELSHAETILTQVGRQHQIAVTCSKDGRIFDEDLSKWDVFVFYTTGDLTKVGKDEAPGMSARGKAALLDAVANGKGFVGSHCASDTFHTPGDAFQNQEEKDPYIAMLGGEFIRHGKQQKARMTVVNPEFPGIAAAGEGFNMLEEWYSLKNFADDLHVLLVNETEGMEGSDYDRPPFPATWARRHQKGRVFYTSMGHREDVWTDPVFQSIFVGGIEWAAGRVPAEIPANIAHVTPQAHVMPPKPSR